MSDESSGEVTRVVKLCIDVKTLTSEQKKLFASYSGGSRAVYNWCVSEWRSYKERENRYVTSKIRGIVGEDAADDVISLWRKENRSELNKIYKSFEEPEPTAFYLSKEMKRRFEDPEFRLHWNRPMTRNGVKNRRGIPSSVSDAAFRDFGSALVKYRKYIEEKGLSLRRDGSPAGSPQYKKYWKDNSFGFSNVNIFQKGKSNFIVTGPHRIVLPKVGSLRVHHKTTRLARYISAGGVVKTARFSQEGERWYVALNVSMPAESKLVQPRLNESKKVFGGDLGVNKLISGSDGQLIQQRFKAQETAEKIIKLQRKLSRLDNERVKLEQPDGRTLTVYKDPRYGHVAGEIKRLSHKLHLQRVSFLHEVSKMLTTRYGLLVFEDLKVANLLRAPKPKPDPEKEGHYLPNRSAAHAGLAKRISDASWGELLRQLSYKSELYGSELRLVNPAYTSRTCHECKHVNKNQLEKWEVFVCESCGYVNDRDVNAAMNILALGLESSNLALLREDTHDEGGVV